jgi:processing peptidase subunit beta
MVLYTFWNTPAFKGTQKRTQQQLEVRERCRKAVEILSDILLHTKLDDTAIERERDVILREMSEINTQQEELVLDHLHATAFQGGLVWDIQS